MAALNLWRGRGEGKRRTHGIAERAGVEIVALNRRRGGAVGAKLRASLPGLTRQSTHLRKKNFFAKEMDARVTPAHDRLTGPFT